MHITILGKPFEVADEPKDFWGWVNEGRYDPEFRKLAEELKPEHTFLDLGAWVGSHSLFASTICRRVIAVEPDPVAFEILQANLSMLNPRPETHLFNKAIMGHDGMVKLGSGFLGASTTRANPAAGGGIGPWEEGQSFDIACLTLRSFVEKYGLEDPLFIKMDVEGAEEQILEDTAFFEEHKPGLLVETHPFWWKNEATAWELLRKAKAA